MKSKGNPFHILATTTLVMAFSAASALHASTLSWDGSASTAWATGTNWTGDTAPANDLITDIALFNLAAYTNQPDAGTTSVAGIRIGDGATATGALTLSGTSLTLGSSGISMLANAGAATISSPLVLGAAQSWSNTSVSTLAINGAVTRNVGAAVNFVPTGTINLTGSGLANTNGILGGWATVGNAGTSGATGDFAALDGSGNVVTYSGYTNITGSTNGSGASAQNWKVTNAAATLTASATVNSLVLTTDFTINSGATMTLGSGGLILSGNSRWLKNGGTGQLTSGLGSGELFIDSSGSASSDNDWRIWTKIVDNGGTAVKLVKNGPGYLRLASANTYTGGTIMNAGVLVADRTDSLGTGAVQVNSGSVTIDNLQATNGTLNNNFSGGGTVTIQNTSNAGLSDNVGGDWSGFTGTLNYNTASRVVNVFASDSMDLSHAAVNFANTGNLTSSSFRTSGTGTTKFGSLAGFGYLEANGATEIGNLGTNTTFSGVIRNAGSITKVGAGTLTLTGANTYTGTTTVSAGTLALGLNGAISNTLVLGTASPTVGTLDVTAKSAFSEANVSGNGTINIGSGKTVTVTGSLAPGFSPGTLNVNGDLALAASTSTTIELAGNGGVVGTDSDYVNVSGSMTLDGLLAIISHGGYDLTQNATYNLFDAASFIGDFDGVSVGGNALTLANGIWSGTFDGKTYTYSEATGVLTVVPEPAAALLGGIGMLALLRRRRN